MEGFILTSNFYDGKNGFIIELIGKSGEKTFSIIIDNEKPVFFVEEEAKVEDVSEIYEIKALGLKTFQEKRVKGLYFQSYQKLQDAKELLKNRGVRTFEADVNPLERYLMERFINGGVSIHGDGIEENGVIKFRNPVLRCSDYEPKLSTLSLDIETSRKNDLLSIGLHFVGSEEKKIVFMQGDRHYTDEYMHVFESEKELLIKLDEFLLENDPDILIGWHVIGFDLAFLENKYKKYGLKFKLGRLTGETHIYERKGRGWYANIKGRVVLDGPPTLRGAFYRFENFKLDTVANELLGTAKDIQQTGKEKLDEIERRFREDKKSLAYYNLMDCVLVTDIYKKTKLVDLCLKRVMISGMLIPRIGLSNASFDHFFLPLIHRKGYIAPNILDIEREGGAAGGFVMDPAMGMHENVIVLDFKSLYPSIIRTFKIDPYSRIKADTDTVETPTGVKFSKTENVLPGFIEKLLKQRQIAKNDNDQALSQAIKILMNSFYGVMGSSGCRFYHTDLPSSITGTGQWILKQTISYLEDRYYEVVYGDTDSVFVKVPIDQKFNIKEVGEGLTKSLNDYFQNYIKRNFQVESYLEIEFEKHYKKLYLPAARGSEMGAKKKYVGLLAGQEGEELTFSGMEFVRSDWTPLAKSFQYEIFRRLFYEEDIETWVKEFVENLKDGKFNRDLIYSRKLTKPISEYTKSVPPHVKAAKLVEPYNDNIREVQYVMTRRGPIPIDLDHNDIDFDHYLEKQIKPLAEGVLESSGLRFDELVAGNQLSLF